MTDDAPVFGLILAGGRGERMGAGLPKPLRRLGDRPLLAHVLDRLAPGVDRVLLSAAVGLEWDWTGCEVVPDESGTFGGPAVGIVSALRHLRRTLGDRAFGLVTAPADTPFLPRDLASRLLAAGSGSAVAVFRDAWIPTCALWRSEDMDRLEDATGRSIRSLLAASTLAAVAFSASGEAPDGDPFFNVNTTGDLERAEQYLSRR